MLFAPQQQEDILQAAEDSARDRAGQSANSACEALLSLQREDGHWAFPLEADATIPAEYILLQHYLDEINDPLQQKMAVYLRRIQSPVHHGWPLFHGGDFNISASVKAYFALKAVGDSADALHMRHAREAILKAGGAASSNVFTRIQLALFGVVPWRAVPVMPVEIMHLPLWFPFHIYKVSYWSRTVIVPLLVLMALKPRARNPRRIKVDELFTVPPEEVKEWPGNNTQSIWNPVFRWVDRVLRAFEPYMPKGLRQSAIQKAVDFVTARLNGDDGLGAIYPAMANAVMMYDVLDFAPDSFEATITRAALEKLVLEEEGEAYCQPCLSPVWDTGLAALALLDEGSEDSKESARAACEWLAHRQILDVKGDWAAWRPKLRPGGWAFQYNNAHYPDLDDTAVVVMALDRLDPARYAYAIERATEWVLGMQSKNGGWGAFDADNTYYYLNHIPFADHGALLDPPTADVSARCLGMLAQLGYRREHPAVAAAIEYLRREQEPEGCWFGRWGTNYIYGTWSVLNALNALGFDGRDPMVIRAVDWLLSKQRADGGWGEDGASYWQGKPKGEGVESTSSQAAWALLGLMAVGEVDDPAVEKGIRYLTEMQEAEGLWEEEPYTAVGFPRVFYLRYHGYRALFPLWALARYRNLLKSNETPKVWGM
ncbi:MAG: squalene--hopene cyclase [Proteobacteria bacterium]|nr:squalene--hopene cyclase [Pseudomonadota bacterium]